MRRSQKALPRPEVYGMVKASMRGQPVATFGLAFLLAGVSAGAADYHIKTPRLLPIQEYPAKVAIGPITIAVDPYSTDEKSFTAFDIRDLNSRGYFPLQVIIGNASAAPLQIRTREIVLVSNKGTEIYTHPATLVVQDVVKGGLLTKIPKVGAKDPATSAKVGSPLNDFTSKELINRSIEAGTTISAFLFFYTAEPKKNLFAGASLKIPHLLDENTRKDIGPFVIPLDPALATAARKLP